MAVSNAGELIIYDLTANKIKNKVVKAHSEEINAVAVSHDSMNDNLIFTGGDDCNLKVWDQRSMSSRHSSIGRFVGHLEGITNIACRDSCGGGGNGGLILASNGKD